MVITVVSYQWIIFCAFVVNAHDVLILNSDVVLILVSQGFYEDIFG